MRPKNLVYMFVSYASNIDANWGHGTPVKGVELTGEIAHKHGIPVTWIVNGKSSVILGERIRDWHDQFGDTVILDCPVYRMPSEQSDEKEKYVTYIDSEWDIIRNAFPWVETKVAACGNMNDNTVQILDELGFQGLWGYCWEQSWWDNITHKGIPWGFWYIDNKRFKAPHPSGGSIVACEWTARDLNQAFHTSSPCIYSTDPNDVLRAGLCTDKDIEYWKKLFYDYLINTDNNDYVFFLQQQESHEMEVTDAFAVYSKDDIEKCSKILDAFFEHIKQFDITLMTLPNAIRLYYLKNKQTAPCYMLTSDSEVRPALNQYTMTMGGLPTGPWPETFLYYDSQCQMAFIKRKCKPHELRNYMGQIGMHHDFSEQVPDVFIYKFGRTDEHIEIEFTVKCEKEMPFGLTYWDDLSDFKIIQYDGALTATIIQNKLVFLRVNLDGNEKVIHIVMERIEKHC